MLGVVIGVAAVISLVDVGEGATRGITNQLQGLGTNLLTINPGRSLSGGTFLALGSATTLTTEDANAIGRLDGIAAVAPELTANEFVVAGGRTRRPPSWAPRPRMRASATTSSGRGPS